MRTSIFLTSLLGLLVCGPIAAQDPVPGGLAAEAQGTDDTSLLGARQQRIKRLMNDLESKFTELASKLREEQPDQAKKLEDAFKQSKELLLMQRMDQITALLDAAKLESATDEQGQVVGDLKALIDLLLYEESEYERLQREIEQLEKWKESLEGLIKQESELQEETEVLEDPKKAEEALDAKMQKAQDLIKKQEDLLERTGASDGSDVDALDQMADEQAELRQETKAFAEETESEEKASAALSKAAKSQRQAENQLGQAKPKDAAASEKEAIEDLKNALQALEKEKEKEQLAKMAGEEAAEKLSEKQSETAGETAELAQEMADAGEPKDGEDSPAASVQKAQEQMNQAAQQLGQNQAGKAGENQEQAQEELQKAKEEVERQLNELRDQAQEEQIVKLAEVFQKMLEKQRGVTAATKTISERRGDAERLRRADRIQLRKWAKEERSLEEDAKAAEQLLIDDGTSVVFRDVVGYLQTEIANVAEMMERQQTGQLVREAHIEIETTLQELVTSLENTQMGQGQPQQPQQGGQGQQQRQSLFPPLAELKLLRLTQQRINRQTTAMEMGKAQPEVADLLKERFEDAAKMQDKLTNMTRQLATQLQPTMTQEDPNAID